MADSLPDDLLSGVAQTIEKYRLCDSTTSIAVALSGGKDSLLLTLSLRELGYTVKPIIVDMGYEGGWADRLRARSDTLQLDSTIVDVRAQPAATAQLLSIGRKRQLTDNLRVVTELEQGAHPEITPCTACYNVKALTINAALTSLGLDRVAFGHHATDAGASLLKSALMYIDRWDEGHARYDSTNMRSLANRLLAELLNGSDLGDEAVLSRRIEGLIEAKTATTDEPPAQELLANSDNLIVRPFFDVWESELRSVAGELQITTEPSGCAHTMAADTRTAREIVQLEVINVLEQRGSLNWLREWIRAGIDQNGRLATNARHNRSELLGYSYKPTLDGIDKL
jgi:tRNA(Ile)-lysidine synthase TilS/MesJ